MKRALPVLLLASLLLPRAAGAVAPAGAMLEGLNALRAAHGLQPLRWDDTLGDTATAYAGELSAGGVLTHRGRSGGSVLERYRSQGGTATLVGEVLGAGAGLSEVIAAWGLSPAHRDILLDARWTHAGAGRLALSDGTELWVALFARRLVEDLQIRLSPLGYVVEGSFSAEAPGFAEPVLYSGIRLQQPDGWRPDLRRFRFVVPVEQGRLYHRLGYLGEDAGLRITDVFFPAAVATSAPETAPR